jgi:predicted metal-dependent peptidase
MSPAIAELRRNIQQIAHHHPFLGAVGMGLNIVEDPMYDKPTSDVTTLFVPPTLLEQPPFDDPAVRRFFLGHNIFHHAFNHPFRLPAEPHLVNMECWITAQDIVVNNLLLAIQTARLSNAIAPTHREKELKFPLFRAPKINGQIDISYDPKFSGWSAERIYVELLKDFANGNVTLKGQAKVKGVKKTAKDQKLEFKHKEVVGVKKWETSLGVHTYFKPDTPEAQETMLRQHSATIAAINHVKSCGSGVGDALRDLTVETSREPDLESALTEIMTSIEAGDPSWAKPQRRWLQDDLYFPSEDTTRGAHLVIAVDVSGSVGQKELHEFWRIIRGLLQSGLRITADIVSCDTTITSHFPVTWNDEESYEKIKNLPGGGGTDFRPIFDWAREHAPDARAIVVFTDLCGHFPPSCDTPTFWLVDSALRNQMQPPFGQTIFYCPRSLYLDS